MTILQSEFVTRSQNAAEIAQKQSAGTFLSGAKRWSAEVNCWAVGPSAPIQQPVVLGVAANPEPDEFVGAANGERAVTTAYPHRPETADRLEVERRMPWVRLEQGEVLVRDGLDSARKPLEA